MTRTWAYPGFPSVRDSQIYINERTVYITYIYRGNYLEETRGPGCIFFLYQQKIEPNDQGACFALISRFFLPIIVLYKPRVSIYSGVYILL